LVLQPVQHETRQCLKILLSDTTTIELSRHTAKFYADTSIRKRLTFANVPLEYEWQMNGKVLKLGTPPLEIDPDSLRVDTLLFRQYKAQPWDTILFKVKDARDYFFIENACCGGFDVIDERTNHLRSGSVVFRLKNKTNKKFLARFGDAGTIMRTVPDTISEACVSPMFPNITPVSIQQINNCRDSTTCEYISCLTDNGRSQEYYYYKPVGKKLSFYFMPLNSPIYVEYDASTGTATIR
jgi:hypothetical protein